MPEKNSALKALLLCLCGFFYKLTTTLAVLLSFSSFLKITGRAGLPYYYIGLSLASVVIGGFLFASPAGRLLTVRSSYWLNPLLAVLLAYVGMNYDSLSESLILALYIAVSLYDIYFGIFFWNFANAALTVKEMRGWVGMISAVTFSGGILLGFLFPLLFKLTSFASCYLICAVLLLVMPVFVIILPSERQETSGEVTTSETDSLATFIDAVSAHPLSGIITWLMLLLAFARYSTAYLFSAALSMNFANETELASFAGAFESSLRLLTSFTQIFLLPLLLQKYRPPQLLRFTPVVMILGATLLLLIPGFYVIVAFQFILLTAIRTFDLNLLNLFFNLYEKMRRNRFRFFSDGIVFAGAVIATGLIIARFPHASDGKMLPWMLLIAGLTCWHIAGKAQQKYVQALQQNMSWRSGSSVAEKLPGDGNEIIDQDAELQKILALPARNWALALGRLSRISREDAAKIIMRLLSQWRSQEELTILIKIAGRNGYAELAAPVQKFFHETDDPRLVAEAVEAIYRLRGSQALPEIFVLMGHANNRVRANAVLAVIRLATDENQLREALRNLLEMAQSERADFRASAAAIAGQLPAACFLGLLRRLLHDEEPKVRLAAVKSCAKLHNSDLIKDLSAIGEKFKNDEPAVNRAIKVLKLGMVRRIESIAAQTGCLQRVNEVLIHSREPDFVELFCRLLLVRPGEPVCGLMERLVGQEEAFRQQVEICLTAEGFDLHNLQQWLVEGWKTAVENNLLSDLLHCLNSAELSLIAGFAIEKNLAVAARQMVFEAICRSLDIDARQMNLFARLNSPEKGERDLALEFVDATCNKTWGFLLKSLAGLR